MAELRTDKELRELALGIFSGTVFTDRHVQDPDDIPSVFMGLQLMAPENVKEFRKLKPVMIFEEMSKAGTHSFNGMPMFLSFQYMRQEEVDRVNGFLRELKEFRDG